MGRPAKAVITQVLADSVTPGLARHGFRRRGRSYERIRGDRVEVITVVPHRWNDAHGGSFRLHLGVFYPAVDELLALYPRQSPPQDSDCHLWTRVHGGTWDGWWEFDAGTDLAGLGARVLREADQDVLPSVTALFRLPPQTSGRQRYEAFHELDHKFGQYDGLWRDVLAADVFHTTRCAGASCTVEFYGAPAEALLPRLERAFAGLRERYAEISWTAGPPRAPRGSVPLPPS